MRGCDIWLKSSGFLNIWWLDNIRLAICSLLPEIARGEWADGNAQARSFQLTQSGSRESGRGSCPLVAGGWWLVAGGWWLVAGT